MFKTNATNDLLLTDFPKPTLTVEPQGSVFTGDSVTLRCKLNEMAGWEILWKKDSNTESIEAANKEISRVTFSDGGEYKCRARKGENSTDYSKPVTVTIHGKYFPCYLRKSIS